MKSFRLIHRQPVIYDNGKKGVVLTYTCGTGKVSGIGRDKIRYVLRAGKMGTGRIVASADCIFCAADQERANRSLAKQAGGIKAAD